MAEFTVTTAADIVNDTDGVLSLREAVALANATAAVDTLRFTAALDGRTLTLTQGQLELASDLAIESAGAGIAVDAQAQSRAFAIAGAATDVAITGLTITGGAASDANGGGVLVGAGSSLTLNGCTLRGNRAGYLNYSYADGGAVFAEAGSRITLVDSIMRDNDSNRLGGGIATAAGVTLRVEGSRFLNNDGAQGGAIAVTAGSSLALARSSLSGNDALAYRGGSGGGIYAEASHVRVLASTISGNRGGYEGGGIASDASTIEVADSTIAGNRALSRLELGQGGAIFGSGTLSLASTTVTGNYATNSLGLAGYFGTGGVAFSGDLRIANSLVSGNYAEGYRSAPRAADLGGTIAISNGHNVFGSAVDGEVAGDLEGIGAARLFAALDPGTGGGALGANGGPTLTVALRDALGNPALSGGEPVAGGDLDQRGVARPQPEGSNPDIGAFELRQGAVSRVASAGNDLLAGTADNDTLAGRGGADWLQDRGGSDRLSGNDGGDTLLGGFGRDVLDGGAGRDTVSYRDAGGPVVASLADRTSTGAAGADVLQRMENLEGGRFADRLEGDALANTLGGGEGADRLVGRKGADALLGGDGADRLNGGAAADLLLGGEGRDVFDYDALVDSASSAANRDQVLDFQHLVDRFDLSGLDARTAVAGDQAFTFLPTEGADFALAGQVRWFREDGLTFVEANVDRDLAADLQIQLSGLNTLTGTDFVL